MHINFIQCIEIVYTVLNMCLDLKDRCFFRKVRASPEMNNVNPLRIIIILKVMSF